MVGFFFGWAALCNLNAGGLEGFMPSPPWLTAGQVRSMPSFGAVGPAGCAGWPFSPSPPWSSGRRSWLRSPFRQRAAPGEGSSIRCILSWSWYLFIGTTLYPAHAGRATVVALIQGGKYWSRYTVRSGAAAGASSIGCRLSDIQTAHWWRWYRR